MKHLVLISTLIILVVLSLIIGSICYLYRFKQDDFFLGASFINKKVIKFADWYKI
jgi:hypothetical protein